MLVGIRERGFDCRLPIADCLLSLGFGCENDGGFQRTICHVAKHERRISVGVARDSDSDGIENINLVKGRTTIPINFDIGVRRDATRS